MRTINLNRTLLSFFMLLLCGIFGVYGIQAQSDGQWKTNDGWVMRKNIDENQFENFFAIGIWGIPGYVFNKDCVEVESEKYPNNFFRYKEVIKYFNLFYLQWGFGKKYMNDVVKIAGTAEFPWFLERGYYREGIRNPSFNMMRDIRNAVKTEAFRNTLNTSIDVALDEMSKTKSDFIWAPFDEVASGFMNWCWPVNAANAVYEEINKRTPGKLVYVDLLGSDGGIANSFLYETLYMNKFGKQPQSLPNLNASSKLSRNSIGYYHYNHKGETLSQLPTITKIKDDNELSDFKNNWFENVRLTAKGYKESGDVFGLNSYQIMYLHPELVGVTVDAIKAGVGEDKPVWMFFDSNGYDKPDALSIEEYVRNLKCQIYTSLVHGATGVLFWNDLTKESKIFDAIIPVVDELKKRDNIFKLQTLSKGVQRKMHYMIKYDEKRGNCVVVVNTSPVKSDIFALRNGKSFEITPLDVVIFEI